MFIFFFTRAKKFLEILNFHKNRCFSIFQRKTNEMLCVYIQNVHIDIHDLEIEPQAIQITVTRYRLYVKRERQQFRNPNTSTWQSKLNLSSGWIGFSVFLSLSFHIQTVPGDCDTDTGHWNRMTVRTEWLWLCFKKTKEMRFTSCTDILCSLSMVACTVQQESRALLMITKRVLSLLSFCFNDLYLYIYPHSLRSPATPPLTTATI